MLSNCLFVDHWKPVEEKKFWNKLIILWAVEEVKEMLVVGSVP